MNPFIETLNRCGENALHFAWPMLWQSSVLIAVLFVFDFALRRHVRAAVRYALWLVLLVKLLLPPSLALPTGAAWWLFPAVTAPAKPPMTKFVVSYGADAGPSLPLQPTPAFTPPPRPPISAAAWAISAWGAIGLGLFAWLTVRWRQVARVVRRATPAPDWLGKLFDETKSSTGLRLAVRLRLTEQAMSPAVCGLFRPVILLPQSLVQKLPPAQLRAVLLHELTHLRRGDVWMNCGQALAQIVYWWHPLLWFANARIRRVREEAVDDVVMLALRDEAETYAPTLLEVAKLAFHRPLASLGLVGILESRSALRQRIERLVNFHAPRKAGLTLVSLCGIFIFSAAALPMGEAPTSTTDELSIAPASVEKKLTVKVDPAVFIRNVKARASKSMLSPTNDYTVVLDDILRTEGVDLVPSHGLAFNTHTGEITTQNTPDKLDIFRQVIEQLNRTDGQCELPLRNNFHRNSVVIDARIYQTRAADFQNIVSGLKFDRYGQTGNSWWEASPDKFDQLISNLKSLGCQPIQRPRIQTGSGMPAEFYVGNGTHGIEFDCKPFANTDAGVVELAIQSTIVTGTAAVSFTNRFNTQAWAEDRGGILIRVENFDGHADSNLVVVVGLQIVTNDTPPVQFRERQQALTGQMNKNPAVIDGIVPVLDGPRASPPLPTSNATNLENRTFKVDTNVFLANFRNQIGLQTNFFSAFRMLMSSIGVNLSAPKSIYFNETRSVLFMRATEQDLDKVEKVLSILDTLQIHIKARFVEVPKATVAGLGANFIPTNVTSLAGILTDPNFRVVIHALQQRTGIEQLAEPEVTSLSGQQTQMRTTDILTVITNFTFQETSTNPAITYQQSQVEVGPVLDVVPSVLPDGQTIDLRTITWETEFLGYDQPPTNSTPVVTSTGATVNVPPILPCFRIRQSSAHLKLWDGQTVVLSMSKLTQHFYESGKEISSEPEYFRTARQAKAQPVEEEKELLFFITVTLVDPAGNRIHSDDEMLFARTGIPPQDSR